MCGIVGYIGAEKAAPIILSGLSKLEYRGYDSAGIAASTGKKLTIEKKSGKLKNLFDATDDGEKIPGTLAIGHTRWATHGKPSARNAHPHMGGRFVVVHNGIIENELAIRKNYLKDADFVSDTDTEVIPFLLDLFTKNGMDVCGAIRQMISVLEGSYALAIIDSEDGDTLYAVKNKSPLLIGEGDGFNMVGSDAMAMLSKTNSFYEIADGEYAVITRQEVNIYSSSGAKVSRKTFRAEIDLADTEKGTYSHYMLKEIEEQPAVIRRIIQHYSDEKSEFSIDQSITDAVKSCDKVYFIACGTSYHASLVGKHYLEKIAGKMADAYIASEFACNMPLLSQKPLFVFVSQSGETADCRAVLSKIKQMGHMSLTITNVNGSTLSREADYTMLLYAGPEIAVASTKAYTAQVAVMAILANVVAQSPVKNLRYELSAAANAMESLCLEREKYMSLAKEFLTDKRNCFYIGRGIDHYVSMEAALKLKEISYIQTEGFAAGELKHGTIALIEKDTPVFAIITQENINLSTRSNIKEVVSRGAKVLCISTEALSQDGDRIVTGNVCELLSPLVTVVPAQYLAYYAALIRECDIDKPRNLAKSVTVE